MRLVECTSYSIQIIDNSSFFIVPLDFYMGKIIYDVFKAIHSVMIQWRSDLVASMNRRSNHCIFHADIYESSNASTSECIAMALLHILNSKGQSCGFLEARQASTIGSNAEIQGPILRQTSGRRPRKEIFV